MEILELPKRTPVVQNLSLFSTLYCIGTTLPTQRCEMEGYWKNKEHSGYPMPISDCEKYENERYGRLLAEFIEKLQLIQENAYYDCSSRRLVNYQNKLRQKYVFPYGVFVYGYLGYSSCRLCDKVHNGTKEYFIQHKDNETFFGWPQGLLHYYKDHKVLPSKWFFDEIMSLEDAVLNKEKECPEKVKLYTEVDKSNDQFRRLKFCTGVAGPTFL